MSIFDFLGNFIKKLGSIFVTAARAAEKIWEKTDKEVQSALLAASGIVAIINKYITEDPEKILAAIKLKFPEFPEQKIQSIIEFVFTKLKLVTADLSPDLPTMIKAIADHLSSFEGADWEHESETIAGTISLLLSPKGTAWNKIGIIIWFVYQRFIKNKI